MLLSFIMSLFKGVCFFLFVNANRRVQCAHKKRKEKRNSGNCHNTNNERLYAGKCLKSHPDQDKIGNRIVCGRRCSVCCSCLQFLRKNRNSEENALQQTQTFTTLTVTKQTSCSYHVLL